MHKFLKLQHHHYSGRVLSHEHTSFRGLALILLVFALSLGGIQKAAADTLTLDASVPASQPTEPAVITNPQENTTVSNEIVVIRGTCQYIPPVSVVNIYANGQFIGSTNCSVHGTFTLHARLKPGATILVVRTANITNSYGPESAPSNFNYQPGSSSNRNDLDIISNVRYVVFGPQKDAVWTGSFKGGVAPYSVSINWGDGTITSHKDLDDGREYSFSHHYQGAETYRATLRLTDSANNRIERKFAAVTPYIAPFAPVSPGNNGAIPPSVYYLYGLLTILLILAWYDIRLRRQHEFAYAHPPHRPAKRSAQRSHRSRRH